MFLIARHNIGMEPGRSFFAESRFFLSFNISQSDISTQDIIEEEIAACQGRGKRDFCFIEDGPSI